jgi:soluble lytic murein transglycosylase
MNRRYSAWTAVLLLATCTPFAATCSAEREARTHTHGIATPLDAPSAASSSNSVVVQKPLNIADLAIFLAAPEYSQVNEALLDGRNDEALLLFEARLGDALKQGKLAAETWFQLGRLRALAAQPLAAAAAFEEASKTPWLLADYCRYFGARAYREAGANKAALALLQNVPREMPFFERAELLRAELLLAQGELDSALQTLRRLLSSEPLPEVWPEAQLLLARTISTRGKGNIAGATPEPAILAEALNAARRVALELAGTSAAAEAAAIETQILAALPADLFSQYQTLSAEQQLVRLKALTEQQKADDALVAANELLQTLSKAAPYGDVECEARLLKAKVLTLKKEWGKATESLSEAERRCQGEDLRARLHFSAGKYAQIDKRYAVAIRIFEQLEQEAPSHRLADDARIRRAQSYLELGDEAKFTELLSSISEDYPEGDVALDGAFELAVRRMDKGDFAQAANVLERIAARALKEDPTRDHEVAGRERYFRARCSVALGDRERGLAEYEAIVRERPLSYYMLHAYSRLFAADPARAAAALEQAIAATATEPFAFAHRPEFTSPAFQRALALARHGELDWVELELRRLVLLDQPELLWSIAQVYGRAGAAARSHQLARGRLTDWLSRWPAGDWRAAWELAFPRPFHGIVERVAKTQEVPEALIYAVMREESAFRPDVVSPAAAFGLMQLIKPTAKHFGTKLNLPFNETALKTPRINIALGASVLSNYKTSFPQNPLLAIPGYNAGPGRPKRWLKEHPGLDFDVWVELIPFTETRRYTKRVLASRSAYLFLYEGGEPAHLLLPLRLEEE